MAIDDFPWQWRSAPARLRPAQEDHAERLAHASFKIVAFCDCPEAWIAARPEPHERLPIDIVGPGLRRSKMAACNRRAPWQERSQPASRSHRLAPPPSRVDLALPEPRAAIPPGCFRRRPAALRERIRPEFLKGPQRPPNSVTWISEGRQGARGRRRPRGSSTRCRVDCREAMTSLQIHSPRTRRSTKLGLERLNLQAFQRIADQLVESFVPGAAFKRVGDPSAGPASLGDSPQCFRGRLRGTKAWHRSRSTSVISGMA